MKTVFKYDTNNIFSGTVLVPDNYQLAGNETFMQLPQPNLMPIRWTGSTWVNATQDEHDAYQQKMSQNTGNSQPTSQQKLNAQLLSADASQKNINAGLIKDIADIKETLKKLTANNATNNQ